MLEVYDQPTWRRISSNINPHRKVGRGEEEEDYSQRKLQNFARPAKDVK